MARDFTYNGSDRVLFSGVNLYNQTVASVVCWFRVPSLSGQTGNGFFFDNYSAFNKQVRAFMAAGSGGFGTEGAIQVVWRSPTGNNTFSTSISGLDDGQWHRLLLIRRNSSPYGEIYIDGVSRGSGATNPGTDATAPTFQGWANNGASPTNSSLGGRLARCAIFVSELTPKEADSFLFSGRVGKKASVWTEMVGASPEPNWGGTGGTGAVTGTTLAGGPPFAFLDSDQLLEPRSPLAAFFRRTLSTEGARAGSRQAA